jgi:hypothetical protein
MRSTLLSLVALALVSALATAEEAEPRLHPR